MGRGEAGGLLAGGVSSFGYSGTIAHVVLQSAPGGAAASAVGGGAALRFRRRAFSWTTAAENAHDGSAIALYSAAWAELAAPAASSLDGSPESLRSASARSPPDAVVSNWPKGTGMPRRLPEARNSRTRARGAKYCGEKSGHRRPQPLEWQDGCN